MEPKLKSALLDTFRSMTLLELSEFRKAFEAEFDVTAAAPVVVQGTGESQGSSEPEPEEQTEFTVRLMKIGAAKIQVIKAVRALAPGLGLADSKALVDSAPVVILERANTADAEHAREALRAAGAEVEVS